MTRWLRVEEKPVEVVWAHRRCIGYHDPSPPSSFDATSSRSGTTLVTDSLNDVGYGFIDIVSARWDWVP
jgi:hypothetical protein